ncbi:CBS domain-containing protein [Halomicrobium sp. HM KBTZ05]|uniref:CBS domain-containing protein n=1 Tax=Halomicrobium mukohataei TaxID=57705 RepID=A0A847UCA7_9EURY|nr:CBS domain-containing protein [Halomicrobium mukohataei]NLV11065.1 CBS domain-containing protein [Halomicrobium mukohataei]
MELPTPDDLRERRTELGLTQSKLADRADVSQPLIARIEGGDVDPRLSTLRRIVNALEEAEGGILRADELMNSPVHSVAPDDSVHETQDILDEGKYSQVPVVRDGTPVGLIGHSDIIQHDRENVGDLPVADVMHESIATVETDATIDEIDAYLTHNDAVLVVDAGETVGIITEADIAAHVSSSQ